MNSITLGTSTPVAVESLSVIIYQQQPVVTTELLAQLYGTDETNIRKNHERNAGRFVAGKHFIKLEGEDLREFKKSLTIHVKVGESLSDSKTFSEISPKARHLTLWTERGAARHAKMLDTDQAWEVFEKLEDCYFKPQTAKFPPENPPVFPGPVSRDQHDILATLLLERFPKDRDRAGVFYLMRRQFAVERISELPASRFVEACTFVQALPLPKPPVPRLRKPAVPAPRNALVLPASGWVTFHTPGNAPVSLPIQGLGGGVDTRWLLVCTRFHGLYAEQLSSDALTLTPAELPDFVRDSGGRVPRKAVLDILEACVSRLK